MSKVIVARPSGVLVLPCVVLGIDPGATSGWAIMAPGTADVRLLGSGQCRGASRDAVDSAQTWAEMLELPLVAVGERWSSAMRMRGGARTSGFTQQGLGASWGRWQQLLEDAGQPKSKPLRVDLMTWRMGIFGGRFRRKSEVWKSLAVARAGTFIEGREPGTDEAEAICIAEFCMRWDKVRAVLGKRHLREHGFEVAS